MSTASETRPRRARTLCGVELPEPEATALAVANLDGYKSDGCRIRRGWDSRSPYGDTGRVWFHFLDHLYRIVHPGGRKFYAAEPYGVEGDDLVELARLDGDGWGVCIGETPLWYPGRTTPILIWRRLTPSKPLRERAASDPSPEIEV